MNEGIWARTVIHCGATWCLGDRDTDPREVQRGDLVTLTAYKWRDDDLRDGKWSFPPTYYVSPFFVPIHGGGIRELIGPSLTTKVEMRWHDVGVLDGSPVHHYGRPGWSCHVRILRWGDELRAKLAAHGYEPDPAHPLQSYRVRYNEALIRDRAKL